MTTSTHESLSLFERIGGEPAVQAVVTKLYERILVDPLVASFFNHVNMERLHHSQVAFVTYAFGGDNHYTGHSMRYAHAGAARHGLNDAHFDRVVEHLASSMRELAVPESLILQAIAIVESTRADVLNH